MSGSEPRKARLQHRGFFSVVERSRPFVTLKLAMTLDGRIATATGESRWITGTEARRTVHAMRLAHDAVLVGGGTARADNPTLTVRDMGAVQQPVRIVASRTLNLPKPLRLIETLDAGPVWLIHGEGQMEVLTHWNASGAELVPARVVGGKIDVLAMLETLANRGLTRIFCEGGGALAASLLEAGMVDELVVFSAGKILGAEGMPGVGALGIGALSDAPCFQLARHSDVGGDVLQVWRATT